MSVLPLTIILGMAKLCAPTVQPETLLSMLHTESGFDSLAIGDNSDRLESRSRHPASLGEAVTLATRLIAAGHNLDLGAAQINFQAGHLQRRGLSIADAFDPCTSLRVGGEVLADCYGRTSGLDEQARLGQALSCYNTGTLDRGSAYAGRVQASARQIVPAIRVQGSVPAPFPAPVPPAASSGPPPPPSWDVWGQTDYQDMQAAPPLPPAPLPAPSELMLTQPGASRPSAPGPDTTADIGASAVAMVTGTFLRQ